MLLQSRADTIKSIFLRAWFPAGIDRTLTGHNTKSLVSTSIGFCCEQQQHLRHCIYQQQSTEKYIFKRHANIYKSWSCRGKIQSRGLCDLDMQNRAFVGRLRVLQNPKTDSALAPTLDSGSKWKLLPKLPQKISSTRLRLSQSFLRE